MTPHKEYQEKIKIIGIKMYSAVWEGSEAVRKLFEETRQAEMKYELATGKIKTNDLLFGC